MARQPASVITDTTATTSTTNRVKKRYRPKVSKINLQDPRYASRLLCQLALIDQSVLRNCPEDLICIAKNSLKRSNPQPVPSVSVVIESPTNSAASSTTDNASQPQPLWSKPKVSEALVYIATDYREAINFWDDFASNEAIDDRGQSYTKEVELTHNLDDEKLSDPDSLVFERLQDYLKTSRDYEAAWKAKGSKDFTHKDFVLDRVSQNEKNEQNQNLVNSKSFEARSEAMSRALNYGDKFRQLSKCLVVYDSHGNSTYDLRSFLIYVAWIWNDIRSFTIDKLMQIVRDYDNRFLDSKKLLTPRNTKFLELMGFNSEDDAVKLAKCAENDTTAAMLLAQMNQAIQRQEQNLNEERPDPAQSTFDSYPSTETAWQEGHQNFNGNVNVSYVYY